MKVIGLTAGTGRHSGNDIKAFTHIPYNYVNHGYVNSVLRAGAVPLILPVLTGEEKAEELLKRLDGIIFTGGADVMPQLYTDKPSHLNGDIEPDRDKSEILYMRLALERNMPLLGICRGFHLLNVALGGTLYQDIKSEQNNYFCHVQKMPVSEPSHKIKIEKDSLGFILFKREELDVNSFHHQAVKGLGRGLEITGQSADGCTEIIESKRHRMVLGVQYHPEEMSRQFKEHQLLFDNFINNI